MLVLYNISIAQTVGEKILKMQEGIEREDLIEIFVKANYSSCYTCMPIYVMSDSYNGYTIISGEGLFCYYKYAFGDSVQSKILLKNNYNNYYNFAKNLLLKGDSIRLNSKELYNREQGWEFKPFTIIDSIINYPEGKKQELIDLAFGESGFMKKDTYLRNLDQHGSLILKLFEWGIFTLYWDEYLDYGLFNYTMFDSRIRHEPADMINDCLIMFLEHINNTQSNTIYILTDFYPYNFDFRSDEKLTKKGIEYVSLEELRNSESNDITLATSLKKGVRIVHYCGIFLESDLLTISFSENIMFLQEEGFLARHAPNIKGNFIYQYSPLTKKWNFIETKYDD